MTTSALPSPPDANETVISGTPPPRQPVNSSPDEYGLCLPVGHRLSEFEINEVIGQGGFGIVYLAYDHSLQRKVALKEYMPAAFAARTSAGTITMLSPQHTDTFKAGMRSFINEAQLLAQFDHASLVKVHRFWEENGTAYMVMPFYEGINFKETLVRLQTPPDEVWLKRFLTQILSALEIIHAKQCYHRDIAPDNILMLEGERPLLLDFGAARRVIGDKTQALTVILKPSYAPFEQYAEDSSLKQGPWTDLYALASVIHLAITGTPPVPALKRIISDQMVPLAVRASGRYSDTFLRAIDAALAVIPDKRPQSVEQFRELLGLNDTPSVEQAVQAHQTQHVSLPSPPAQATPGAKSPAADMPPAAPQASKVQQQVTAPPSSPTAVRPVNKTYLILTILCVTILAISLLLIPFWGKNSSEPENRQAEQAEKENSNTAPVSGNTPKETIEAIKPSVPKVEPPPELAEQKQRAKWEQWQADMERDFAHAESLKGSNELKAREWNWFLSKYSQDNPNSNEDEALRQLAQQKKRNTEALLEQQKPVIQRPSAAVSGPTDKRTKESAAQKDKQEGQASPVENNSSSLQVSRKTSAAQGGKCPDLYTKVSLGIDSLSAEEMRYFNQHCK